MTYTRNDGKTHEKDEARTPPEIFRKLDEEFHFILDVACTRANSLCIRGFFHEEGKDGLIEDWVKHAMDEIARHPYPVWVQPPYSNGNILKFVHKAWLESGNGATVVLLIPSDTSTEYFDFCFHNAAEIRFMQPRVKFNRPDGTPFDGSPQTGSMIVVFKPGEDGPAKCSVWKWKD